MGLPRRVFSCQPRTGAFPCTAVQEELISKADVLLEALPYLQRYRGKTFVIKYGGSFMDSPDATVRDGVARDVVFLAAAGPQSRRRAPVPARGAPHACPGRVPW